MYCCLILFSSPHPKRTFFRLFKCDVNAYSVALVKTLGAKLCHKSFFWRFGFTPLKAKGPCWGDVKEKLREVYVYSWALSNDSPGSVCLVLKIMGSLRNSSASSIRFSISSWRDPINKDKDLWMNCKVFMELWTQALRAKWLWQLLLVSEIECICMIWHDRQGQANSHFCGWSARWL